MQIANNNTLDNINIDNFYKFLHRNNMDIKQYQEYGVKWAIDKEINGTNIDGTIVKGGIIADEMGLGKTIQSIGIILANPLRHTLIVLPLILIQQWQEIFQKTLGHSPLIYHGNEKKKITLQQVKQAPVVLTTYGTLANRANSPLFLIKWDRVMFDEAHHLRNINTNIYTSTLVLFANADNAVKWMITGTPIQNYRKDIINLCNILGVPISALYHEECKNKIAPIIIRRTKQQLGIQIAKLDINNTIVNWENKDEKILAHAIHNNTDQSPLVRTIRARQVCIYPNILKHIYSNIDHTYNTKIQKVVDTIIERKDNGNKKIIFCQFKKEINIIHALLNKNLIYTRIIDGDTTTAQRHEIIHNMKVQAIILQVQTTSEGLNLQHYNEVYFVSPHWNPAIEDQAIARCHRIGQKKDVIVYKFIMDYFQTPIDQYDNASYSLDIKINISQDNKRNIANHYLT
jgi:SNF2 family DNA or RNA helicase